MTARTDHAGLSTFSAMRRSATSGGRPAGLSPVGARLGVEGLEAAVAVEPDPPPDGFGGDVGPVASGDGVGLAGLVAQLVADARRAQRQMHQVGDDAVSEERDRLAKVVV